MVFFLCEEDSGVELQCNSVRDTNVRLFYLKVDVVKSRFPLRDVTPLIFNKTLDRKSPE